MATPPIKKIRCVHTDGTVKFLTPRFVAKSYFHTKGWKVQDVGAEIEVAKPVEKIIEAPSAPATPQEIKEVIEEVVEVSLKITPDITKRVEPKEVIPETKRDDIDYGDITKKELTQLLQDLKIKYKPLDTKKKLYDQYINR